eukprot:352852-Chlamydomonas_euryale.AAC.7
MEYACRWHDAPTVSSHALAHRSAIMHTHTCAQAYACACARPDMEIEDSKRQALCSNFPKAKHGVAMIGGMAAAAGPPARAALQQRCMCVTRPAAWPLQNSSLYMLQQHMYMP